MSIRDLVVTGVILGLLPMCLARPWIGLLVWSWIGYMNPHRLTWGFAYSMPFAQLVAVATSAGFLFTKDRRPIPRTREVVLLSTLWVFFFVTTTYATHPEEAWEQFDKVSKILIMVFATLLLFQDWAKLRWLLYVIALSIGFFGFKGGIWAILTGGSNRVLGPPGSFIAGNTEIGLALVMVLPLLLHLSREAQDRRLRYLLRAVFGLSVVAVLITRSRGALLGLMVVLPLLVLKSRLRLLIVPLALATYLVGPATMQSIMPDVWIEQMGTISEYEQDRSANMRLNSWKVAYLLALDHPFLGAGFRPFSPEVYLTYSPEEEWNTRQDAHSIYFQVLAEHGFTGLVLYLGLIAFTMLTLRRVARRSRTIPELRGLHDLAAMVEVSLAGFLVSGAFLSMSYFDLFFHLLAIAVILSVLLERHIGTTPEPDPAPSPVPMGIR